MGKIILKKNEEIRILQGHSWVFANEVLRMEGNISSGEVIDVFDYSGKFVGKGFLNTNSKILVRIVSRHIEDTLDKSYFRNRLRIADEARLSLGYQSHYRVLFGEADGIPGLIVDKYADVLVMQVLSLAIDMRKNMFIELLLERFQPKGIFERSDPTVRQKEGIPLVKQVVYGEVPDFVRVEEDGILLDVDVKNGQKTGLFLDQADNHRLIRKFANNQKVLDCFSHVGQFALHAKKAGAKEVIAVDSSEYACDRIRHHSEINHLPIEVVEANVFDFLRDEVKNNSSYDVIVLDPPAFAKSNAKIDEALRGYKEINLQAMKLLRDGGILISASCSHYMTPALFFEMLTSAAHDAGKKVQMVDMRIQGSDHPTLLGSEETLYLKLVALRVESL